MRKSPITKKPADVRFFAKVVKGESCWLWTGYRNAKGYGEFGVSTGRSMLAHRFSYQLAFGAVPQGLSVLHRCDTPACVNPDHLFVGTLADNNADMRAKGRHAIGSRNGAAKLDESTIESIRASSLLQREIAVMFGVSQGNVSRIKSGNTWRGQA